MGRYEELLTECEIEVKETNRLPKGFDGWYQNGKIFIRPTLPEREKLQTLHEELAHHKFTYGNILDQKHFNNRKFENYARRYSYETSMPLSGIVEAFKQGVRNLYELANFFEITEGHVLDCIEHYKKKYGLNTLIGDYLIEFEPLRVFEYKNII
ncbi:ImmA/IrrE family metallo-endopeptidase [Staphylococcus intermedius]|uniref:ImmA/IrrE family metallo-endopeptidase n=1 Tax=Staphylococcus intermedius TaxID=1285 RepID=UPI000BBB7741|nr:ImmA/IrrE family metallo-endopeptidase [Staphylococcus intermedius]PCF64537.1 toxin [Staphylococcus intermedius]PCF81496.1 toxin [Staphylococcus intermedius]